MNNSSLYRHALDNITIFFLYLSLLTTNAEKKRVLENVEEHQEDFLSVYENLEKKQQKIKDLEVRHLKLQKQWEEESRNFAKSEIEKQLHKGNF